MLQLTGLVVHMGHPLSNSLRRLLEDCAMHQQGVTSARFTESRPHQMLIEYDRQQINSFEIIHEVNNRALQAG
ncbi:hypothetical protein MNBD_GAMMA13-1858 [hydrothermal vent metagenome]|uniref:HMA domain-containing protein n=1 Tax=hydrothermal vent metagenome TaxID=652676 RepID=A0A3B0YTV7_9ZZZZ